MQPPIAKALNYKVSFSIVLYEQAAKEITAVIDSLLLYKGEMRIFLIDNSSTDKLACLSDIAKCIEYHYTGKNIGFGKAHNTAFALAENWGSKYHFFVNPDICYSKDVVAPMTEYMEKNHSIGQMMPRILFPDGRDQYLPKLTYSPSMLFWRKMKHPRRIHERRMQIFEMRGMENDRIYDVACVSGCFAVARTDLLNTIGGFDDRFFLYFEDTDLSRRIHEIARTVYFPMVSVYHTYARGAQKSPKLFLIFISSLIKYFNKWGWFLDKKRKQINDQVLRQL